MLAKHRHSDSDDYSADEDEERRSGDDDALDGRGMKRAAAELGGGEGGSAGKKAKRKSRGDAVFDPELGREVVPWRVAQAETVGQALQRYGADRLDIITAQVRLAGR